MSGGEATVIFELWNYLYVAEFQLPPTGPFGGPTGTVKVDVTSGQKVDEKAGSGTDKASTTQQGTKLTKADVEITFTHRGWIMPGGVEYALSQIDPNNQDRLGGPFDVRYPDLNRRGCTSMLVEEVGKVEWQPGGGMGKVKIKLTEWVAPAPQTDATTTPTKSDQSTASDQSTTASSGSSSTASNAYSAPDSPDTGTE